MNGAVLPGARFELQLAFAALAVAAAAAVATSSGLVCLAVLSAALALAPNARLLAGREQDPFAPIHLFVLYAVLTIHVRALIVLSGNSGVLQPLYASGGAELRDLVAASVVVTSAFLAFLYWGYYCRAAAMLCAPLPRLGLSRVGKWELGAGLILALFIAAPVGALLYRRIGTAVAEGRFTAETRAGGIFWMGYLLRFAVFGAMLPFVVALLGRRGRPIVVGVAIALLGALAVFLLWPKKIVLANQILGLLVGYHYLRHRIRPRTLLMIGMAALLLLPVLSAFRYWGFAGLSPTKLFELAGVVVDNPSYLLRDLFRRSFGLDSLVLIIADLRRNADYELGGTLLEATRWFIPRAMWPDKPPTYAIAFGQEYLARSGFFSVNVSGTPTIVGELLLNFGLVGITVGGFLAGVLLRLPYEYLVVRGMSYGSVFLYSAFLAGSVMIVEGPLWPQVMDTGASLFVVACLLLAMQATHQFRSVWIAGRYEQLGDARRL